jgi:hypothetical protein
MQKFIKEDPMEIQIRTHKVYVNIDTSGIIMAIESDAFPGNFTDWTQIDEGSGDQYAHAQNCYFESPLTDNNGRYNYKLVDGKPVERTDEEKQADAVYIERVRAAKLAEISAACQAAIYAGVDAADTKGTEHFSLSMADQTNLSALASAIAQGAASVPYHSDGQLCREFTAAEYSAVYAAAKAHITRNTTLCNHLNVWTRRCTTVAEISAISYESALPADLQANFDAIMGATE